MLDQLRNIGHKAYYIVLDGQLRDSAPKRGVGGSNPLRDAIRGSLKYGFPFLCQDQFSLKENYEKTKFCGVNLLSPCTESNAVLAHKRYVEQFPHMFTPMGPEEQVEHFRRHCEQIKTEKVVCSCKFCTDAINMGGKQGVHLLELLFPAQAED